ncbi:MAG: hypothetical protein Q9190_004063 [Brigantiaea leucoxantha]
MLPSAKSYLTKGGLSPQGAAYSVIGCFLGGVVGIQFFSRILHHFIPSHVVDCDHTHEDDGDGDGQNSQPHEQHNGHTRHDSGYVDEETALLQKTKSCSKQRPRRSMSVTATLSKKGPANRPIGSGERPTLQTRVSKLVSGAKTVCDVGGPCYGYGDPCAQECFKAVTRSHTMTAARTPTSLPAHLGLSRATSMPHSQAPFQRSTEEVSSDSDPASTDSMGAPIYSHNHHHRYLSSHSNSSISLDHESAQKSSPDNRDPSSHSNSSVSLDDEYAQKSSPNNHDPSSPQHQHHHHVPTNAFLSIGLQTSIAIALHKLPEGFITFATNHANPHLGFAVFMALFIHNITEGFAMALPLYLAIGSRWKAMFWSSLLGGISQPFGAGVAALWFKVAGSTGVGAPGERVYGCMFAITAGIMASVALTLFEESLAMTHQRGLCMVWSFVGMGVLGISFALTAG